MALTRSAADKLWERRWDAWKLKASKTHGDAYAYPDHVRVLDKGVLKVRVLCKEHGEFLQAANKHLFGQGCAKCVGRGADKVAQLSDRFPELDLSGVVVTASKETLILRCASHGEFETRFNRLMTKPAGLPACPMCARLAGGIQRRISRERWVERIAEKHGEQLRLVSATGGCQDYAVFACWEHGEFQAKPTDVIVKGSGCPTCGGLKRAAWVEENLKDTLDEFVEKARVTHGDTYDYAGIAEDAEGRVRITCRQHGAFWQRKGNHKNGAGCPRCVASVSEAESEMAEFIKGLGVEVVVRDRGVLEGSEIDILVPALSVGVEYCGNYWHGENYKAATYHKTKRDKAHAAGVKLITVFEDEWLERRQVVEVRLANAVGKARVVAGRKTKLVSLTWAEARDFLETWHLAGAGLPGSVWQGLKEGDQLVAVAVWGASRYEPGKLELYRYCTSGCRIVGGLGKFVAGVKRGVTGYDTLVTYADLRWGSGEGYRAVGFQHVRDTRPNYFWCKASSRFSRQHFQKHKLKDKLVSFDPDLSEVENCHANGYWRIYDCGSSKWEMQIG